MYIYRYSSLFCYTELGPGSRVSCSCLHPVLYVLITRYFSVIGNEHDDNFWDLYFPARPDKDAELVEDETCKCKANIFP